MSAALLLPIAASPTDAAGIGVKYTTFSTPVKRGATAKVTVHSKADARCNIKMVVNGVTIHPAGMGAKSTSAVGNASWTWTLPKATKTGTWPVTVTCQSGSHKGSVAHSMRVTN